MSPVFSTIMISALTAVSLAPLVYAIATLHGMRYKRLYPLLRYRTHDGRQSTVYTVHACTGELNRRPQGRLTKEDL